MECTIPGKWHRTRDSHKYTHLLGWPGLLGEAWIGPSAVVGYTGAGKNAWMLWRTTFLIDEKYTPIKAIGKGAYGVVCSAKVAPSGDKVAIKKIGTQ